MVTALSRSQNQRGMNTAEYAVGTVAACGFGLVLLQFRDFWWLMLMEILAEITHAFSGPMLFVPR